MYFCKKRMRLRPISMKCKELCYKRFQGINAISIFEQSKDLSSFKCHNWCSWSWILEASIVEMYKKISAILLSLMLLWNSEECQMLLSHVDSLVLCLPLVKKAHIHNMNKLEKEMFPLETSHYMSQLCNICYHCIFSWLNPLILN